MGVAACRSVLGRNQIAQWRWLPLCSSLKSPMTTRASSRLVQWFMRRRGWDVVQPSLSGAKRLQRLRNQFEAIVHSQHHRRAASGGETLLQLVDEPLGGDRALYDVQQGLAGALVDHRRDLDGPAVDGGVELEVQRPPPWAHQPPPPPAGATGPHVCVGCARGAAGLPPSTADAPYSCSPLGARYGAAPPTPGETDGMGVWSSTHAAIAVVGRPGSAGVCAAGVRR